MRAEFRSVFLFLYAAAIVLGSGAARGQSEHADVPAPSAVLSVKAESEHALELTAVDLANLPRHRERVTDHNGAEATFEGVPLVDILRLAGTKVGDQLRGKEMTTYVLVGAADDYHVVFALPELDPGFTDRVIFLADRRDGQPLAPADGPLRIIVPHEKRQARWVRQVTSLTVLHAGQ
ncbi:MAG TPA: molybdopterin-dependent oxidoreductase [Candidatus Binatia bacterium]|nr:molybdopterin-dependent oxidoreductase [Candidatus Binatia bacterium]